MTKTRPIFSLAELQASNSGYLGKVSNSLFAALKAHSLKVNGKKVVVTNGVFDILHVGHVRFLEAAKARGDFLIVGVNSDEAVKKLKGPNRPINHQDDRIAVLAALESVDLVVLVNDTRVASFIEVIRPNVWAKGSDYSADTLDKGEVAAARQVKAEIALLELVKGVSTTVTLQSICLKLSAKPCSVNAKP